MSPSCHLEKATGPGLTASPSQSCNLTRLACQARFLAPERLTWSQGRNSQLSGERWVGPAGGGRGRGAWQLWVGPTQPAGAPGLRGWLEAVLGCQCSGLMPTSCPHSPERNPGGYSWPPGEGPEAWIRP